VRWLIVRFMDIENRMFVRANLPQVLYARNTNLRSPRRPVFANALAARILDVEAN